MVRLKGHSLACYVEQSTFCTVKTSPELTTALGTSYGDGTSRTTHPKVNLAPSPPPLGSIPYKVTGWQRFATHADVKRAVTSSLQTRDTYFSYAGTQASVPGWDTCIMSIVNMWGSGVYHLLPRAVCVCVYIYIYISNQKVLGI